MDALPWRAVQPRLISIDEIPTFQEVGACGTATVCVPIASITNGSEKLQFGKFEVLNSLREECAARTHAARTPYTHTRRPSS